jgi:FKBP-type peptidyl-prolyl cis-trans isomerase
MAELNGRMVADIEDRFTVGSGDLPVAINRSLKQMTKGEQIRIVAPWYTAYGTEGTKLIKPYTNLVITLTINKE